MTWHRPRWNSALRTRLGVSSTGLRTHWNMNSLFAHRCLLGEDAYCSVVSRMLARIWIHGTLAGGFKFDYHLWEFNVASVVGNGLCSLVVSLNMVIVPSYVSYVNVFQKVHESRQVVSFGPNNIHDMMMFSSGDRWDDEVSLVNGCDGCYGCWWPLEFSGFTTCFVKYKW